jgi:hypothetical protein
MYWGKTLYAMPFDGDIHLTFYNKVAFERSENKLPAAFLLSACDEAVRRKQQRLVYRSHFLPT